MDIQKTDEGKSAPDGAGGLVWAVFKNREGFPVVQMTEKVAATFEKRGHVTIIGSNKYQAQEVSDMLKSEAKAHGEKADDGIRDAHV